MKKVGKVFSIIGGIFAILVSAFFALVVIVLMTGILIAEVVLIINMINAANSGSDVSGMIPTLFAVGIEGLVFVFTYIPASIILLLSGIFAFISTKRKKALNIVSIVITSLSAPAVMLITPMAIVLGIIMMALFIVFIILALTPVTWIYLVYVLAALFGWLSIIFIILGNIISMISVSKEKKQKELEEQAEVIDIA